MTTDPMESGLGALVAENARLRELLERALDAWDRIDHIEVSDFGPPFVTDEFQNIATELEEITGMAPTLRYANTDDMANSALADVTRNQDGILVLRWPDHSRNTVVITRELVEQTVAMINGLNQQIADLKAEMNR